MTHPGKHGLVLRLAEARDAVGPAGPRRPCSHSAAADAVPAYNSSAVSRKVS